MPLHHRIIACLVTCTLGAANAAGATTNAFRLSADSTASSFGEDKPGHTVKREIGQGPHERFVLNTDDLRRQGSGATRGAASMEKEGDKIRERVKVGQKIVVINDLGRRLTGRIGELRSDDLTLLMDRKRTDVRYDEILRIDLPADGIMDGTLAGLGAGAGLGLVCTLLAAMDDSGFAGPDPGEVARIAPLLLGGIGAAIGLAVDASRRHEPNLYVRQGATRVRVTPVLGRTRQGVAISVTW